MPATEQQEAKKTTNLVLNSSGTSTDVGPSAFDDLARRRGFPSCAVRDGRETYGREDLHSYVKCPVVSVKENTTPSLLVL